MAMPFAALSDLQSHWPDLPPLKEEEAGQKLMEASLEVRGSYPTIDARIANGLLDPELVILVVCRMVKRALNIAPEMENVSQTNNQAGPFGMQTTFRNTDGQLYFTKADRRLLGVARNDSLFSFLPGGG